MTPKEKAERYDEALRRARKLKENPTSVFYEWTPSEGDTIADYIFPELKESEDERIRKAIHIYFDWLDGRKDYAPKGKYTIRDMIAWLEKQGENHDDKYNITGIKSKHAEGKLGEMIKEIKSADKAEPKFKVKYAGHDYNVLEIKDIAGITFYGIEDEPNHIDYVQAEHCKRISGYAIKENGSPYPTKPAKFSEQNSTWSEEDEEILDEIIDFLENGTVKLQHDLSLYASWLKSLKNRVQPQLKQEWSDEDENIKEWIMSDINKLLALNRKSFVIADKEIIWLKSLRSQNTWKPSDAQMIALNDVITNGHLSNANERILKGLQEQLKKLK